MDAAVLLLQLASLEEESSALYHRLRSMTFLVPRVSQLFDRLSQEEMHHKNLIELVRSYQSQAEEEFQIKEEYEQIFQNARGILTTLNERISNTPPRPPFLDILEDVLDFEKSIEGRHYDSYLEITEKSIKELLLRLNQYDREHIQAISGVISNIRESLKEQSKKS